MTEAIRIHNTGGPEVMSWEAVNLAAPGPGEVLVRHHYVGVNFIDIYHRRGMYKLSLPSGLGSEAAGVVEAVGPGVSELRVGDRVACATGPVGAYAEARVLPAERLVRLPDDIRSKIPQLSTAPEVGQVQTIENGAYTVTFGEIRLQGLAEDFVKVEEPAGSPA